MDCLPCSVSPPRSLSEHSDRAQRMSVKDRSFCSKGHHGFILLCCIESNFLEEYILYLCSHLDVVAAEGETTGT